MSDIVIKAENLGKKYTIGHQAENGRYVALRDVLMQSARTFWHKTKDLVQGKPIIQGDEQEDVWALKDVSLEIRRGEAVGIIGRNGAGKSTLLKILSRITEPSAGRVTIKGRVAGLLEVGTGFHPELTGRENIYLNGGILGMARREIRQRFEDIVEFAEIERFVDTPVKRYSSGMYVRLAFAVAAHLEPEVLLVDEVLAVGDAQFQRKCLGKMWEMGKAGRTVLFVSHNLATIAALCSRAILLENGNVRLQGDTNIVIAEYAHTALTESYGEYSRPEASSSKVWIEHARLQTDADVPCTVFSMTDTVCLRILLRFVQRLEGLRFGVMISEMSGVAIYHFMNVDSGFEVSHEEGALEVVVRMPRLMLYPSSYLVTLDLATDANERLDYLENKLRFTITQDAEVCRRRLVRSSGIVFSSASWGILNPDQILGR